MPEVKVGNEVLDSECGSPAAANCSCNRGRHKTSKNQTHPVAGQYPQRASPRVREKGTLKSALRDQITADDEEATNGQDTQTDIADVRVATESGQRGSVRDDDRYRENESDQVQGVVSRIEACVNCGDTSPWLAVIASLHLALFETARITGRRIADLARSI